VSYGFERAFVFHRQDRPLNDHWQPFKRGLKMDDYFGLFSLKSSDLRIFFHDEETNSGRGCFCYDDGGVKIICIEFGAIGFFLKKRRGLSVYT